MPALRDQLQNLAHAFADQVFEAIRSASLHELSAGSDAGNGRRARAPGGGGQPDPLAVPTKRKRGGRLARRSPDELEGMLDRVVAALKIGPMRAEEIKASLGLDRKELPRVLALGLTSKALKKKGQKRGTVYSVA